jgi:hypothetical protein
MHDICTCSLQLYNLYMVNRGKNLVDDFASSLDKLNSCLKTNVCK